MTRRGIVCELRGSNALVELGGGEGCGVCSARESCMSITGKTPESKKVAVENLLGASVGDAVELELPVSATMKVISLTFILPVALLLGGYWVFMPAGSAAGALGAVGGLLLGLVLALVSNKALGNKTGYRLTMTAIVEKNCPGTEVTK